MEEDKTVTGSVLWQDLTVQNAESVGQFYSEVIGWNIEPVSMGGYSDYNMLDSEGDVAAGVCHARGVNSEMPPQWLLYIKVESVADSAQKCVENGGEIVFGPGKMGKNLFAVIKDPAGAVLAIME
jgi:hypothetical protein